MRWTYSCASLLAAGAVFSGGGGCSKHRHDAGHDDHGHGTEARTAQITVFGERHEIFAEHRLVVAGTPTRFVTHITDLKTREPRREGPVRFRLSLGREAPIEQIEKAPTRAGIYEAMLTFPRAGEWSVALFVPAAAEEQAIDFPKVKVHASAHDAAHAVLPEAPAGISFLKEQQWKILAGTEPIGQRRLIEQLRLPASVAARPGSLAHVPPPSAGRLLLPPGKAMPLVGDRVEAGQLLALIQPAFSELAARLVEAEGELVRARLALEQAESARQRVAQLARAEAKSRRELQETEYAVRSAQVRYETALALQATYRQAGRDPGARGDASSQLAIELRSPIAGTIIAQSGAAVGEQVGPDKAVFTVLDATTVFVEAPVPEGSVNRLGTAKAARYALPGEPHGFLPLTGDGGGRLVFAGIHVDPATRTVPLVYEVTNLEQRLRVGQAVDLYVETARAENALAVPASAIVEEDGRPIAFVQVGGETFEKRDLTLGIRDGDWVQVLAGLKEGERVVTRGAYAVRLASVSSTIPAHGHAH